MSPKHAFVIAFALSPFAFAGPDDDKPATSIPMIQPSSATEALDKDYRAFVRSGQPFPSSPTATYLLRLDPTAAPQAVVAAAEAWILRHYPSIEQRPIDELQDGLADSKGAKARETLLRWLLKAQLPDARRQQLAVAVFSRESNRECRQAVFESLHAQLLQGQDFGVLDALFKVVETDSASIAEAEKFLAVRALVSLAERLPENRVSEVHRRLAQIACDQSSNVSEEIVRSLGASLTRPNRLIFIHQVLSSGRYPALAKIGALALVKQDVQTTGRLDGKLEAALRLAAAAGDADEVTQQEMRSLLAAHRSTISDDDCPAKVSRLCRRNPRRD